MIAQTAGVDGFATLGFTVPKADLENTLAALRPLSPDLVHDDAVSKVSIVGAGMRKRPGVAARLFAALAREGIEALMITTADIKISILVNRGDGVRAVRVVHREFGLEAPRIGAGLPGAYSAWPTAASNRENEPRIQSLPRFEDVIVNEEFLVNRIDLATDHGRLAVAGIPDQPGNCARVFEALASDGVVVGAIVLNRDVAGVAELTFSVPHSELERAHSRVRSAAATIDPSVRVSAESDVAVLVVWGVGMRSHAGVARTLFGALADCGVKIRTSNTSEVCITVVVDRGQGEMAQKALREAFQLA
jgi:aspartate kinase